MLENATPNNKFSTPDNYKDSYSPMKHIKEEDTKEAGPIIKRM
jgi:hypothetical protein